jgi:hypothetical protein
VNHAPPAPALWEAASLPATGYHFVRFAPGWYGAWHPLPRRRIFFVLKGKTETEASGGTGRPVPPGRAPGRGPRRAAAGAR